LSTVFRILIASFRLEGLYPGVSVFESGVLPTEPLAFLARSGIRQNLPIVCPSVRSDLC